MATSLLYEHQKQALTKMKPGSILCGGVGTGKSRVAIAYFITKICNGNLPKKNEAHYEIKNPVDLYIITTARKRDTFEWDDELAPFLISRGENSRVKVVIDSWNNIGKYVDVENSFFIFDEQRLVGTGKWTKSFWKIAKKNKWILLTATPGDNWMDYAPVFIANGFYKNITEFRNLHVVYKRFSDFPQIDHYVRTNRLEQIRKEIVVPMDFQKIATQHHEWIKVGYDTYAYDLVTKKRWDIYKNEPIRDASSLCYILRKVVNSSKNRLVALDNVLKLHQKLIVFYNFDYELEALRSFCVENQYLFSEWNGHKHEPLPTGNCWLYLVQYSAGAEGWNCVVTDSMVFFSQNYSWKIMDQAAGRIDRMNTSYTDLYYFHFFSDSEIDKRIKRAVNKKRNFSESNFYKSLNS